jgi:hypothetical protein
VVFFDALGEEVFGHVVGRPSFNLGARMHGFFFLIRLFSLDIRHSVVNSNTILAARVCGDSICTPGTGW